jgi:hypothetical protein
MTLLTNWFRQHCRFFPAHCWNEPRPDRLAHRQTRSGGTIMTKLAVTLLAGTAALFVAGGAQAAPLVPTAPVVDNGIENVRLVCNEWGRCWQTRGPRYYSGDSYNSYNYYEPSYRYRRHYGPGVQFNAPGVHFGIGVGPTW